MSTSEEKSMRTILTAIKRQFDRLTRLSHTITPNTYDGLVMQVLGGF
jgi:hypothetical protein